MSKNIVYGLDAAPTHGALVSVTFRGNKPFDFEPVAHYTKKDDEIGAMFSKTTDTHILATEGLLLANWLSGEIPDRYRIVYVDYTVAGMAFLPSGKVYSSKWSFVMGTFFSHTNTFGVQAVAVSPYKVRKYFGLSVKAGKEALYQKFFTLYPKFAWKVEDLKLNKVLTTDYMDAALLAVAGGS